MDLPLIFLETVTGRICPAVKKKRIEFSRIRCNDCALEFTAEKSLSLKKAIIAEGCLWTPH
jgi:hypothetical protein